MNDELNLVLTLGYAVFLGWIFQASALRHNWRDSHYRTLCLCAAVGILCLWRIRAGIYEGLDLHFLALPLITLMFGWRSAILIATTAQLVLLLAGVDLWHNSSGLLWLGTALPIGVSYLWLMFCHNLLPRNLWIYVFIGAFLNGALIYAVRTFALALWYHGQYDWTLLQDNYLILIPLFIFPEAMLNGFPTTLMVVYRPQWLATWDEKGYLHGDK
ncbi:energy-coupling factor ABC transporter permease [Ferrimonas gelatinilytica]|uniref:Energy-coupling factor ABC transporter permease n=1 Tax=Ferrimonas gelatinilytica TaxID=1255257 RepID=A0ABP9RZ16_9GAMM